MIRIRPAKWPLRPEYFKHVWAAPIVRAQPERSAETSAGICKVSQPDLQAVRLPLPSIEGQALAVKRVDSLLALTDRMELRYAAAVLHAKRLAPRILAKAFRGEWLPQDRNDEPAGALLARLAAERSDREHA